MSSTPTFSPGSLALLDYFRVNTSRGAKNNSSDGDETLSERDETSSDGDQKSSDIFKTPRERFEKSRDGYIRIPTAVVACSPGEGSWDEFADVPKILESAETLRYMGFRPCAAHGLFEDWLVLATQNPREAGPAQFLKYVVGSINDFVINVTERGNEWDRAIKQMGFRKWVRSKKKNPRNNETRLEKTAKGWALWAVTTGWKNLECMDWRVKHNRASIEKRMKELEAAATPEEVEAAAMLISMDES